MAQSFTFGQVVPPQHRSWAQTVKLWRLAEALGFDSIRLNDHLHSLSESIDHDAFEAAKMLAALAMTTTKPKPGVLTYGSSHRNPAIQAKELVTIDHMSGGRVGVGIVAGWNEPGHAAYVIPFPGPGPASPCWTWRWRPSRLWTRKTGPITRGGATPWSTPRSGRSR